MTGRDKIKALMMEAHSVGDTEQVALCKRALGKREADADPVAVAECLRVIAACAACESEQDYAGEMMAQCETCNGRGAIRYDEPGLRGAHACPSCVPAAPEGR